MASTGTAASSAEKKNGKNTAADAKAPPSVRKNESVYKAEELAAGAEDTFGTTPECVLAALRQAGITECTKEEAAKAVKAFRERKVG
ncbi:MAG: hypothetical protein K2N87_18560 [Eubacterium sp.]|nr:hypothetical protein [Eubacterium sp.]